MKLYHGSNVKIETIDPRHYINLDELIKRLQFVKPKYQYFFASESAISALKRVE